eukprot:CAMPEP_0177395338 /NCGR_PEP_ID=MMETSP0368-20130122/56084_1 /TAXON_ID=447022 ORGANISM="Scrippsiella hangoei-like, Strain SHHI-4" /NCGR_SAMPLE_ID=MMETSP0368 /ASSEMBLY_ACC=CAM_ASM_000363 /LENGTH=38 /DNA_ID= /DNA_START= /DNA_END= /DNA_ORIENTATION=
MSACQWENDRHHEAPDVVNGDSQSKVALQGSDGNATHF